MKYLHTFFLLLVGITIVVGLSSPLPIHATGEIVTFRSEREDIYTGTDIHKGNCHAISLNEQLTAKVNGKTGKGCNFTIDVVPGGEWVHTGTYFDTPPYAWETDTFYSDGKGKMFSFTCANPTHSFDSSTLPSYVTVTQEETIPATAANPAGKRYSFSVSPDAENGASFNADFSFSTSCNMFLKISSGIEKLVPVENQTDLCGKIPTVEINPRENTLKLPLTVGESCLQELLPSKTPTPTRPACNEECELNSNTCPQECGRCEKNSNNAYTCQPPPPTPTLTPKPPACNSQCNPENNQCPHIGCPDCVPASGGKHRCQAPTPTPPTCNDACDPKRNTCPQECGRCEKNSNNAYTCQPPPPTPTLTPKPPACGSTCNPDNNQCAIGCPLCQPGSGGTPVCQSPPTSTPRPTHTPAPSSTPRPTHTPVPTATPTPPPKCAEVCVAADNQCPLDCPVCATSPRSNNQTICRQPASCDCDGFEYSGQIGKGEVVTFTAYVKVDDPDNNDGKGKDMVFHVEADGVEVAQSNPVPVTGPTRIESATNPIDRYQASWSYTIPSEGTGVVEYRAYVKINCSYKSLGSSAQSVVVLAASTKNQPGVFARIMQFFSSVFQLQPAATPTPTLYALPTGENLRSGGSKTLKLGTLNVDQLNAPAVQTSCKEVRFWIQY